jgi:hypothetical protein
VADVPDIAVQRFDVVAIRVEKVRGVVAVVVGAVAGRAVRLETRLDAGTMEVVDLFLLACREAQVGVLRRRPPVDDVEVREARPLLVLDKLRNAKWARTVS